jgi:hypothetical protein
MTKLQTHMIKLESVQLGKCRKQFCLFWLPQAVDFKVSCSQILHRAFAGIPTTLWLRVRRPSHSAMMLHSWIIWDGVMIKEALIT